MEHQRQEKKLDTFKDVNELAKHYITREEYIQILLLTIKRQLTILSKILKNMLKLTKT